MKAGEISEQEAKVYLAIKGTKGQWTTNQELYKLIPEVSGSIVRRTTKTLFLAGLLERVETHPYFRYRWSTRREGRDHDFETKMEAVCEALGLSKRSPEVGSRYCATCGQVSHADQLCE